MQDFFFVFDKQNQKSMLKGIFWKHVNSHVFPKLCIPVSTFNLDIPMYKRMYSRFNTINACVQAK